MRTLKKNQKKTRTALWINLCSASVREIEISGDPMGLAWAIDCANVEPIEKLKNSDMLYVDKKAMTNGKNVCSFVYNGKEYFGDGILIGFPIAGEVADVITKEDELDVTFINR